MPIPHLAVDDLLLMKKSHPCGSNTMRVLRVGSDLRLQCTVCKRDLTVARVKLEKNIKQVLSQSENEGG